MAIKFTNKTTKSSDRITAPHIRAYCEQNDKFSISFWWKPSLDYNRKTITENDGILPMLLAKTDSPNNETMSNGDFSCALAQNGQMCFRVSNNTNCDTLSERSQWDADIGYHVVLVWHRTDDSAVASIWINGLEDNETKHASLCEIDCNKGQFVFGLTLPQKGLCCFAGHLGDVRYYNRTLSPSEIAFLSTERSHNELDDAVGLWKLDDFTEGDSVVGAKSLIDSSINANHGTPHSTIEGSSFSVGGYEYTLERRVFAPHLKAPVGSEIFNRGYINISWDITDPPVDRPMHVGRVALVVVGGLRPDAINADKDYTTAQLDHMLNNGAYTLVAKTDSMNSNTLPNIVTMLTGMKVETHGFSGNTSPSPSDRSLEAETGHSLSSVFEVIENDSLSTSLYTASSKLSWINNTWPISRYRFNSNDSTLAANFTSDFITNRRKFGMLYLDSVDTAGHSYGWMSSEYLAAVHTVDGLIHNLYQDIQDDSVLADDTAVIVVSDHGGEFVWHDDADASANNTVPFLILGPDILNRTLDRAYAEGVVVQTVRTGNVGPTALWLMGYDSRMNAAGDSLVSEVEADFREAVVRTDEVTYELEYTEQYAGNLTDWHVLRRRIPWTDTSYRWRVGKTIKGANVRLRMRARTTDTASEYSMSNEDFSVNVFKLTPPGILNPISGRKYSDSILIILDETLTAETYHQKIRYKLEYQSEKRSLSFTTIVEDLSVGQNVIRWAVDELPTSDDYILKLTVYDPDSHQHEAEYVRNIHIQQSGLFYIDTKPPQAVLSIADEKDVTNERYQLINVFAEDETTEVSSIQMREMQGESILSLGDFEDPYDPEPTELTDIGKPTGLSVKTHWLFEDESGIRKIEALLTDAGGNNSYQTANQVFLEIFCSNSQIADFIVTVEQIEESRIEIDEGGNPHIVTETVTFEVVYLGTITGEIWILEPFARQMYSITGATNKLFKFNQQVYITSYSVARDRGYVYRDIKTDTPELLQTFSRSMAITNGMAEYNSELYIGHENGDLWSFNGISFTRLRNFDSPINTLYADSKYLYIGFQNSDELVMYDGASFYTNYVETG